MKIKLLKKLRSHFVIQQRNNEFRLVEKDRYLNGFVVISIWTKDLNTLKELRRGLIIRYSSNYKVPKYYKLRN